MKLLLGAALVIFAATSCESKTTTSDGTTTAVIDTPPPMPVVASETVSTSYAAKDGDVMLTKGVVLVYNGGTWTQATTDTKMKNGVIVSSNGRVKSEGREVILTEGEKVDVDGNFWDDAGNAIADGWDATKKGASKAGQAVAKGASTAADKTGDALKDAGQAIGKGAKKVGEKTKEIVNGKNN